ncbi:MAG: serine hydrolase domain-containing protein [bacterium]
MTCVRTTSVLARIGVGAALVISAQLATVAAAAAQAPDVAALSDKVLAAWSSPDGPGCAVGIDRAGQPRFTRAYGSADLEFGVPNRPETIFEGGSISKQFTAAATMLLVLDGKLRLDDDVRKYVPELPQYERTITIRHLLNHTSGLRDWGEIVDLEGWPRTTRAYTMQDVLAAIVRQRALNYPPGDRYAYTNSGYNLLAIIVERVSGTSFPAFTKARIFQPLGMTSTQWRDDFTRIVKGRAQAYSKGSDGWRLDMPFEKLYGNSSLLTTVSDLLTWTAMLEAPPPSWRALADSVQVRGILTNGDTSVYAAGLVLSRYRGVPTVEHNGATAGYRTNLVRYPGKGLAIAILCNVGDVDPRAMSRTLTDGLLASALAPVPAPAPARPRPAPTWAPTSADLAAFTGTYYSPDVLSTLVLSVEGNALVLSRAPATRIVLKPTTDAHFAGFGTGPSDDIWFTRGADGRVNALHVRTVRAFDVIYDRQR